MVNSPFFLIWLTISLALMHVEGNHNSRKVDVFHAELRSPCRKSRSGFSESETFWMIDCQNCHIFRQRLSLASELQNELNVSISLIEFQGSMLYKIVVLTNYIGFRVWERFASEGARWYTDVISGLQRMKKSNVIVDGKILSTAEQQFILASTTRNCLSWYLVWYSESALFFTRASATSACGPSAGFEPTSCSLSANWYCFHSGWNHTAYFACWICSDFSYAFAD